MGKKNLNRKFCVAPMMGYTTPHARRLYRMLSKKAFLFTEMIATNTMIHSKTKNLIIENYFHNPIAVQVGGSDIKDLAQCSKIAKSYNYDEINLNVGCPSKAVQKGSFGACLMKQKKLVRNSLEAMKNATDIEVSIKCRIGLGKEFNYDFFSDFINEIAKSEINVVYVHARNAILGGLSPKANRSIPPLNYNFVKKIKKDYPKISFILNGGIENLESANILSKEFDGVMLGRLIQNNPFCLNKVDKIFFEEKNNINISENLITDYFNYIRININHDSIFRLFSPLLQIFFGIPNSKKLKNEIHYKMQNNEIKNLEYLFLDFIKKNKEFIFS